MLAGAGAAAGGAPSSQSGSPRTSWVIEGSMDDSGLLSLPSTTAAASPKFVWSRCAGGPSGKESSCAKRASLLRS